MNLISLRITHFHYWVDTENWNFSERAENVTQYKKNRLTKRLVELQAVSSGDSSELAPDNSKYDMIK